LQDLVKRGDLAESGPTISAAGFSATMAADRTELGDKIAKILDQAGFEPPKISELSETLHITSKDITEILGFLSRDHKVVKIKDDMYLSRQYEELLKKHVGEFILKNKSMVPADMKTLTGSSRKYAIPYFEYLDRIRFTMRVGDVRKLVVTPK
jgi:selenocysteine-specific elongation factor